ncbi:hypothetical protein IGI65_000047 [Enterococcus sp. DIV0755b]|uniref:hypothetical protein n=1 Tax=Enterococcus sp. DIV0755b TaxID=2774657 RepID=UPI003F21303D
MDYMFKTPDGTNLNTPKGLPDIVILERRQGYDKRRYEYDNGLIIIIEAIGKDFHIDSNFKWFQDTDDSFSPSYQHPNPDFVDPSPS